MPYSVTLTRGAIFANIADGTINQTSTMTLIGRDFANYGQFVDQDFIRLLESGAATANSRPTNALTGQLWYDLTNTQLKIATQGNIPNGASYTGNAITWQGVMPARSANAPSAPSKGDQWMYVDSVANIAQLIVYNELKPGYCRKSFSCLAEPVRRRCCTSATRIRLQGKSVRAQSRVEISQVRHNRLQASAR